MRKQAGEALDMIGVDMDLDEEVSRLAVAQKQIIAISRAILQNAKLIIMDEPTTALTKKRDRTPVPNYLRPVGKGNRGYFRQP